MPLYDYISDCGAKYELLRGVDVRVVDCPNCGGTARRAVAHRVQVVGPTTDTRGLYRRYVEATGEMDYNARQLTDAGQSVTMPPLWQAASATAAAMKAADEAPRLAI